MGKRSLQKRAACLTLSFLFLSISGLESNVVHMKWSHRLSLRLQANVMRSGRFLKRGFLFVSGYQQPSRSRKIGQRVSASHLAQKAGDQVQYVDCRFKQRDYPPPFLFIIRTSLTSRPNKDKGKDWHGF